MTRLHATVALIGVTAASLAVSHVVLWRKHRRNEEYMDAMKEYVSRMVDTECGRKAFQTIVDGATTEEEMENAAEAVDWSDFSDDEPIPYELTDNPDEPEGEPSGPDRLHVRDALRHIKNR